MNKDDSEQLKQMNTEILEKYSVIKFQVEKDIKIDEFELDSELLRTPLLYSRYTDMFIENTLLLKDFYSYKEKIKLERWKFYSGKQNDKYYKENGIMHEKILKTDIDRYLSADEKIKLINDICSSQKAICDYLEKITKEISNRGFHIKSAIDWRRFTSGN